MRNSTSLLASQSFGDDESKIFLITWGTTLGLQFAIVEPVEVVSRFRTVDPRCKGPRLIRGPHACRRAHPYAAYQHTDTHGLH